MALTKDIRARTHLFPVQTQYWPGVKYGGAGVVFHLLQLTIASSPPPSTVIGRYSLSQLRHKAINKLGLIAEAQPSANPSWWGTYLLLLVVSSSCSMPVVLVVIVIIKEAAAFDEEAFTIRWRQLHLNYSNAWNYAVHSKQVRSERQKANWRFSHEFSLVFSQKFPPNVFQNASRSVCSFLGILQAFSRSSFKTFPTNYPSNFFTNVPRNLPRNTTNIPKASRIS